MTPLRSQERRILLSGVLLALLVSSGVSWLVLHALAGARAAAAERHRAVVERVFDEMEGELSALVAREEARSFLEYRYFYVPDGNAYQAGLVQSELAKLPNDSAIVGWFQLDPGGVVNTPVVPRDNELSLANRNGWSADSQALALRDELAAIVRDIPGWSEPTQSSVVVRPVPKPGYGQRPAPRAAPAPRPPEPVATGEVPSSSSPLKLRGSSKRANRQAQVISTSALNVDSFNPGEQQLDQMVFQSNAQLVAPVQSNVEVVVSPFSGLRKGNYLVLHRMVHTGSDTTREEHHQGLVLRLDVLQNRLESTVLDGSSVRPWLAIGWNGSPVTARTFQYDHRFAEPFTSLAATITLDRVPELIGREAVTVRLLAAVLLGAITVGGLGLFRAVQAQLEYARRRNDFVAAVSHELKTPLTTIRMYAEMLRDGMVPSAAKQHAYHHTITMESDRLGRLIANVLELARLERGGVQPTVLVGQLEPIVREAVEVVYPHAKAAGFHIEVTAEEGLPPVNVDHDALIQIIVNLIDNSVKFTTQGERVIELHLRGEGDSVLLTVRDHGPGVPTAHLRKVFEPFWRGERELTRRTRGTGIGLALVRGLAQRMDARVWGRNHPDGGFLVTLRFTGA